MNQGNNRSVAYIAPQITDLGSHAAFVQSTRLGEEVDGLKVRPCPKGEVCFLTLSPA